MAARVVCRGCGSVHTLDDSMRGFAFDCPRCGAKCLVEGTRGSARLMGGCLVVLLVAWLGVWAMELFGRGRSAPVSESVPRSRCAANLRQIGAAIAVYAGRHGGWAPVDARGPLHSLALLYPLDIDDPSVFVCPEVGQRDRRRFPAGCPLAGRACSYGYDPDQDPALTADETVIAADLPGNHPGGHNVLFRDGRAEWREHPFCSADPSDDIFAPDPHLSPGADAHVRQ